MWESKHVTWEKLLQPIAIVNIHILKVKQKQDEYYYIYMREVERRRNFQSGRDIHVRYHKNS